MAKQVMPKAVLEPRPSDVRMTEERYQSISLFKQLKSKISLDKYPGTVVVRRFHKGEVVCRQGEAGWTAFYILTTEDMYDLGLSQLRTAASPVEKEELQAEVTMVTNRLALLRAGGDQDKLRTVATVHLALAPAGPGRPGGLLARLFGRGAPAPRVMPRSIPIDGPTEINSSTMTASVQEGELFGEMSCLYRTPRSATIVAEHDCYMLEMLRNILDQIQKDKAYKEQMDKRYKDRVLQTHVRKLSVLGDLADDHFLILRNGLELCTFEPGQVICDEHDRSDSVYIVRSGLVKVVKKASALLHASNIRNWPELCTKLKEGAAQPENTPRGQVWKLLPETTRAVLTGPADAGQLSEDDKTEILLGLNDVIKNKALAEAKEVQGLLTGEAFKAKPGSFPAKVKDWGDQDVRLGNRFLLETLFPTAIRAHRPRVGPEHILRYCARGDLLGEIGLMRKQPRSASCIAFGHPLDAGAKESGRVELVRIPEKIFWKVLELAPGARAKLEALATARQEQTKEVGPKTIADETSEAHFTQQFQKLGLIQGQRLMLIDLDRCTRCDECVRACVNTHADGRSRLFLDGPRFDKYLVPTTCRSCLDPVCMIGCPVGSIHRGDNGQIIIENWCIGCGLCAKNCPYGSIQMHDLGLIPAVARGWKFTSAALESDGRWIQPRYSDRAWAVGQGPFAADREFQSRLTDHVKERGGKTAVTRDDAVYFRYEFQLGGDLHKPDGQFKVEVTSTDPAAKVWINGHELVTTEKAKRGKREFWVPQKEAELVRNPLRAGRNVLAVQAKPDPNVTDVPLLEARLDAVLRPDVAPELAEDISQKQVTELAVVCDLCSGSFGKVPACVNACPHDAAMRVDARFEFPM